ncbi:transposase [Patescibacteria group bacterium]|nr:transposase [Patescibacteria group bacterium]
MWISDEEIEAWKPSVPKKQGGQVRYSVPNNQSGQFRYTDGVIQCLLKLRRVFRLPLRGTEAFVRSILELLEFSVSDYTTMCKRSKGLRVS